MVLSMAAKSNNYSLSKCILDICVMHKLGQRYHAAASWPCHRFDVTCCQVEACNACTHSPAPAVSSVVSGWLGKLNPIKISSIRLKTVL